MWAAVLKQGPADEGVNIGGDLGPEIECIGKSSS
jgi:hypothetical protein